MKSKKKVSKNETEDPVVFLGRLPLWISEQKTVHVFSKSHEILIKSLPSSSILYEYRLMKNSFVNKLVNESSQNEESDKRLTRSTGQKLDVDFNAKLPDDRNYNSGVLGACSDPFLGFESCHHAIYLSNSEAFQFLSNVEDKIDFVFSLVVTDIDCTFEKQEGSGSSENKYKPKVSSDESHLVEHNKRLDENASVPLINSLGQANVQNDDISNHIVANGQLSPQKVDCSKDFCRLGCMCESLKAKRKRTHCGHADCMFSKKCLGPSSTSSDSSKLTLLSKQSKSPEGEVMPAKRTRKPPKRWLEEEEELEYLAEIKKRSRMLAAASPSSVNKSAGEDDSRVLDSEGKLTGTNRKCVENNLMNSLSSYKESIPLPKRPLNMAMKSTSGRLGHQPKKVIRNNAGMSLTGNFCSDGILKGNNKSPSGAHSLKNTSPKDACKSGTSGENLIMGVISRQYFRNYKEYRRFILSEEVRENEIAYICTSLLSPLQSNSIRLIKWLELEAKVRQGSAYMWLSQVPKCVAKVFVTERDTPPCTNSINLKNVENVCNIQSSIDYFFQLFKNHPDQYICCILSCQGYSWEIKGNLNMKTKSSDRIIFKIMRSSVKGVKELTFENGGKKILITESSTFGKAEDAALCDHYVLESEINEIPEPDIYLYDSNYVHFVEKLKPSPRSSSELDWYCLNLDKSFDKIIVDKSNIIATYPQMLYALQLSKQRNIAVRISCHNGSNYMFNNQVWKQGVYADYSLSEISVRIGPYHSNEVPDIRAFVKVDGIFCRTVLKLSKEPLNVEAMPRVINKENKLPHDKLNESLLSCDTNPKAQTVEKGKVEFNCPQLISSSLNGSNALATTSYNISDPNSIVSGPIEYKYGGLHLKEVLPEPNASEPGFNIRIESVLGNWSGFDDIANPVSADGPDIKDAVVANDPADSNKLHTEYVESGYLVSEIPNLKAIAVTKGGWFPEESNKIVIVDPSWSMKNISLTFASVEDASIYLGSISRVKLYPDNLEIQWTFVEDSVFFINYRAKKSKRFFDIRNLTEDQFITANGVFSYNEVCSDSLPQYGLKLEDNRRLLEYRRRREIRDAKNELISLLPSPKTDVLVKVIHRSRQLIRSLQEGEKDLLEQFILENNYKTKLLSVLRKKCPGEKMYQIFEQLEKISRPHTDTNLNYDGAYRSSTLIEPTCQVSQKGSQTPVPKKNKARALGSNSKELPKPSASLPPKSRVKSTFENRKVSKSVESQVPSMKVVRSSPLKYKTTLPCVKSVKDLSKTRSVFSGRYVSAATKRSLRKYNFIIPCLARKNHFALTKPRDMSFEVCNDEYQKIPLNSTFSEIMVEEQGETDKNPPVPKSMESFEEMNLDLDPETSVFEPTHEYIVKEETMSISDESEECETNGNMTEGLLLGKSDPLRDHGTFANPQSSIVHLEVSRDSRSVDQEKDSYSGESFIDVG
ncbi:uncharacterized protein ocm [Hetaerina americana]|uniref:uncharacterized protein ocm n=1 Tax=Hetaerina americana TaxID=62018 RepID=UPI003A7F1EF3